MLKFFSLILLCWTFTCSVIVGHTPELSRAYPVGGKQGSSTQITCLGKRLQGAKTLLFYKPGITAGKPKTVEAKKVIFPITIAKDAPYGEYLFRVVCDDGLTELRSYWVGPYPSVFEKKESNNIPQEAQEITLNHTIIGQTQNEDLDFYKIRLKKNQIVSMELEGMRLGRVFYDPFIAILDSNNTELASSDDSSRLNQDPRLSFKAPQDGDYYLMVRDSSYQGNGEARYRLHVGDFVYSSGLYPLGAQRGKLQVFTIKTEHEGDRKLKATYKKSANLVTLFPTESGKPSRTAPSPHYVRVTDFPFIQEKEPNGNVRHKNQPETPAPPIAFHGTIEADNDMDWFRFSAKKGQRIRVKTFARSLGSPVDTAIQIRHPDGKYINVNDDATQGDPDSKIDYTIPKDGNYWITVRDQLKRYSPQHHYRLEITMIKPEVTATLAHKRVQETQKWKAFVVPQGGMSAYQVNLAKSNFKGELDIIANSLPTGVSLKKVTQMKEDNKAIIYLLAKPGAPIAADVYNFQVMSRDKKIGTLLRSEVYPFLGENNRVFHTYHTEKVAIAVTKPAPYKIELIQPTQPIVQSGTIAIKVRAHREPSFDGDITMEIPWKPAGMSANYSVKIPKGKSEATLRLAADGGCPLGKWDLCVRATANTKQGPIETASNIIKVEVKAPYLKGKLEMAATTRGVNTEILCKLSHTTAFAGKAKLMLYGLPDGIVASPVEITKDTKEVAIKVTVPDKARVGKHGNLFCRVQIPQGNLMIPHTIGQGGTLRVNPPPKKKVAKKENPKKEIKPTKEKKKKPLSRLEELRKK